MAESTTPNSKPAVRPDRPAPKIDGGFIILRRDRRTRRYTMLGHRPFEHGSQQEAEAQAAAMAERFGDEFAVLQQAATIFPPVKDPDPALSDPIPRDAAPAEIEAPRPAETSPPKPAVLVETKRRRTLSISTGPKPAGAIRTISGRTKLTLG